MFTVQFTSAVSFYMLVGTLVLTGLLGAGLGYKLALRIHGDQNDLITTQRDTIKLLDSNYARLKAMFDALQEENRQLRGVHFSQEVN